MLKKSLILSFSLIHFPQIFLCAESLDGKIAQEFEELLQETHHATSLPTAEERDCSYRLLIPEFKKLIEKGASVNSSFREYASPLMFASEYWIDPLIQLLLEEQADVNLASRHSQHTAFLVASNSGAPSATLCLLAESRADLHLENDDGDTALTRAIEAFNDNKCKLLLDLGVDIERSLRTDKNVLELAKRLNFFYDNEGSEYAIPEKILKMQRIVELLKEQQQRLDIRKISTVVLTDEIKMPTVLIELIKEYV